MSLIKNLKGTTFPSFSVGKSGATIYQGTGIPSNGIGIAGDVYIRVNGGSSVIYQKQSGVWTVLPGSGSVMEVTAGTGLSGGTITTTGTISISANGISNALFRQSAASTLVGNSTGTTGNVADITLGTGLVFTGGTSLSIGTSGVTAGTYNTVTVDALGRVAAGTNTDYIQGIGTTVANGIVTFSGTAGNILQNSGITIDTNQSIQVSKSTTTVRNAKHVLFNTSVDNVQAELFMDGSSQRILIPADTSMQFKIQLIGRRTDTDGENIGVSYSGVIIRNTSVASTAIIGSVIEDRIEDTANNDWLATVMADPTNGALAIYVAGRIGRTVKWCAIVETIEVTG